MYNWVIDDLLKTPSRELLGQVRLKVRTSAKRMGIMPSSVSVSSPLLSLERWLDVERLPDQQRSLVETNYLAWQSYVPRPYPGRVTLFRARARPIFQSLRPDLGWGEVAQGGVEIHVINGQHWKIMVEPIVRSLAEQLRNCLERPFIAGPFVHESGQTEASRAWENRAGRLRKWRSNWRALGFLARCRIVVIKTHKPRSDQRTTDVIDHTEREDQKSRIIYKSCVSNPLKSVCD